MRELNASELEAVSGGGLVDVVKAVVTAWILWETLGPLMESDPVPPPPPQPPLLAGGNG
jgi:hypothetical protein